MAKKAQTEAKAKGLIANVGDYRGKTLNLSKKQLGKSGRSAAASRTVDISQTRYENKRVVGPKGKALTGRVDLGGGNIAVYNKGVRVRAQKPKAPSSGGGTPKPSISTTRVSPSARGEGAGRTRVSSARMGAEGPKVSVPRTTSPTGRVPFSRGIGVMAGASSAQKSARLKQSQVKSRFDRSPEGQRKNALGLGILATIATGGLAGGSTAAALSGFGSAVARGAGAGLVSGARYAAGQGAARGASTAVKAAAQKVVTPFKEGVKSIKGTTKNVSKVTGGPLKGGKPVKTGPKKPTAAQMASSRRKAAAQKAAATRRANAAKTARGRKNP